ncbi:MAG: hypothetical protein HY430_02025 [Candidatus Levybacteria bacterium]|nr:hypothetical protein [Candidatus Levybacteria bacterium]
MTLTIEGKTQLNGNGSKNGTDAEVALADQIDTALSTRRQAGEIVYKRDPKDPFKNGHASGRVSDTFRVAPAIPIPDARDDPGKLTAFMRDVTPDIGHEPNSTIPAGRPPNPASGILYAARMNHAAQAEDGTVQGVEMFFYPAGVFVDLSAAYRQRNFGGTEGHDPNPGPRRDMQHLTRGVIEGELYDSWIGGQDLTTIYENYVA